MAKRTEKPDRERGGSLVAQPRRPRPLVDEPQETMSIGNGGWVRYFRSDTTHEVFARFGEDPSDGRLTAREVFVYEPDGRAVTPDVLRSVPLGRIEGWVNGPNSRALLVEKSGLPGPDLVTATSFYSSTPNPQAVEQGRAGNWAHEMLLSQDECLGIPKARKRGLSRIFKYAVREPVPTLYQPEKRPYPDSFFYEVALAYSSVSRWSDRPAVEISEAHDVPVSTVHRWIKEARKRGFLPPGRAGKVG